MTEPITRKEAYLAYLGGDTSVELPEPLTREEMWLHKLCINGAGVMFGEETTVKEVLAECQPEFNFTSEEDGISYWYRYDSPDLVVGETYIVTWNGVDYRCVAIAPANDVATYDAAPVYAILGNVDKMAGIGDTGEPFIITAGKYNAGEVVSEYQIYALDGSTTLTISIRQEVTEVKQISGKYVEGMGWSETKDAVLVDNVSVNTPVANQPAPASFAVDLVEGETYVVVWDGKTYDCVASIVPGPGALGLATNDFMILPVPGQTIVLAAEAGTHTVSISGKQKAVYPVDSDILPAASDENAGIISNVGINKLVAEVIRLKVGVTTWGEMRKIADRFKSGSLSRYAVIRAENGNSSSYHILVDQFFYNGGSGTDTLYYKLNVIYANQNDIYPCLLYVNFANPDKLAFNDDVDGLTLSGFSFSYPRAMFLANPACTKQFKITVDDNGTLSVAEITDTETF